MPTEKGNGDGNTKEGKQPLTDLIKKILASQPTEKGNGDKELAGWVKEMLASQPPIAHLTEEKFLTEKPQEEPVESVYFSNPIMKDAQGNDYSCGPAAIFSMLGEMPVLNALSINSFFDERRLKDFFETGRGGTKGMTTLTFARLAYEEIRKGRLVADYKKPDVGIWVFADLEGMHKRYDLGSMQRDGRRMGGADFLKDLSELAKNGIHVENAMLSIGDIAFLIRNGYNVAINYSDHYLVAYGVTVNTYADVSKYAELRFFDPATGDNMESTNTLNLRAHLARGNPVEGVAIRIVQPNMRRS